MPREEKETLMVIVDEIHRQADKNMSVWHSKDFPGVSQIISRVSRTEVLRGVSLRLGKKNLNKKLNKIINSGEFEGDGGVDEWVVNSSFPNKWAKVDGSHLTAIEFVIAEAAGSIAGILNDLNSNDPNTKIRDKLFLAVGSPFSIGGSLSKEFVDFMREKGYFGAVAALQAELINSELSPKVRSITIWGQSHGADMAKQEMLAYMRREDKKREPTRVEKLKNGDLAYFPVIRVLSDEAVLSYPNRDKGWKTGLQRIGGGVTTSIIELPLRWRDYAAKLWIGGMLEEQMMKKGELKDNLTRYKDNSQVELRILAYPIITEALRNGPRSDGDIYPEGVFVYERQGIDDLTLTKEQRDELQEEYDRMVKQDSINRKIKARHSLAPTKRPGKETKFIRQYGSSKGHGGVYMKHDLKTWWAGARLLTSLD